ncbi:hypothetical protein ACWA06_09805 [Serratia rhizosphaerae]|uniref:hypothetical protein n=1 Tax=unclassified Serratia (in: enterobacteria) TaxID=2647522 RepID=UPI0011AB34B1|nr:MULTISPECIES: hypothetical protein [unclassified Serratia (in: enterobacteria)]MBU3894742.1 hypothetical protein [Serratia rubidaea]MCA4822961.1 hypothetical protein [Serratia rubidaea]
MNGILIYIAPSLSILSLLSFSLHSRNMLRKKPVQRHWLKKKRRSVRRRLGLTCLTPYCQLPQAANGGGAGGGKTRLHGNHAA